VAQIERDQAAGKKIEIWFGDEARVGQKNKITRRWALRGTRPIAPHDQRTQSTYIFGAICPAQGKAAGLILPFCNITTMNLHLAEISQAVAADAHAVLLVDQAGWHTSDKLRVPDNISIVLLPPKSPELNPTENTWQTVCSFAGSEMVRPHYAASEGCAGLAGAWPPKGDNPCSGIAAAFLSGLIRPR
jgi:hypothetical protein